VSAVPADVATATTPAMRVGQIVPGVPAEVYHQRHLDVASNSGLAIIDEQTPRHYHHWVTCPEDDEAESAALVFGKALHCATLEPEVFRDTYLVLPTDMPRDLRHLRNAAKPSDTTLAAIARWDEWEERARGRHMLSAEAFARAEAMAASLRALELEFPDTGVNITVAELIDECQTEVTLCWDDERTGVRCKARADLWSPDLQLAMDLKSCESACREPFARAVYRHRYHVQHAHYCEGFRACGHPVKSFLFLPAEKARPHVSAAWHIDAPAEELGYEIRERSLDKLAACLKSNRWPGPTTAVGSLSLPAFAFYNAQD